MNGSTCVPKHVNMMRDKESERLDLNFLLPCDLCRLEQAFLTPVQSLIRTLGLIKNP